MLGGNCARSLWIGSSELWGEGVGANSAWAADSYKAIQNTPVDILNNWKKNRAGTLVFQHVLPWLGVPWVPVSVFSLWFWAVAQKSGIAMVTDSSGRRQIQLCHLAQADTRSVWGLLCVWSRGLLHVVNCIYQLLAYEVLATKWGCSTSDFKMVSLWWHCTECWPFPSESGTPRLLLPMCSMAFISLSESLLFSCCLQTLRYTMLLPFSSTTAICYFVWTLGVDNAGCCLDQQSCMAFL